MTSFAEIFKKMTESGRYVDWSQTAFLLREGTHRYSAEEIAERLFVVGGAVIGGFLACYFNEREEFCSKNVSTIVATVLTGTLLHGVTMKRLVEKRKQLEIEGLRYKDSILDKVERLNDGSTNFTNVKALINDLVLAISNLSAATATRTNLTLTLGRRKNLFAALHYEVNDEPLYAIEKFLKNESTGEFESTENLIEKLNEKRRGASVSVVKQSLLHSPKADFTTEVTHLKKHRY